MPRRRPGGGGLRTGARRPLSPRRRWRRCGGCSGRGPMERRHSRWASSWATGSARGAGGRAPAGAASARLRAGRAAPSGRRAG
eukprot:15467628-Alexandrium_andersonii.AAC.1